MNDTMFFLLQMMYLYKLLLKKKGRTGKVNHLL